MSKKPRFPIPRYPRGWFQVGYADELGPRDVVPLKYFGVDLVMFRTEDGEVSVLDAFCPHMGAHLGPRWKGRGWRHRLPIPCLEVRWRWQVHRGAIRETPAAQGQHVTAWPVIERNGIIMVWHDIDGKEPEWDIPEIPEWEQRRMDTVLAAALETPHPQPRDVRKRRSTKRTFRYVHGMQVVPQPHTLKLEYPSTLRWSPTLSTTHRAGT